MMFRAESAITLYRDVETRIARECARRKPARFACKALRSVSLRRGFSERTAKTANTHARKGTSGRHPDRYQVANLIPSKRCSRVPLIGLARLRRALEGVTPSFDPIQLVSGRQDVGRHGNGVRQEMA
jgi:hypothetical protein